ncbi:TolC family protein [Coprobacter tertius]|uniref:TolC family protein n=1 Tax=Coprobacter tertius TaxID=2944915 RepID=A0ABT1MJY7_9BACT|nr:TolC family protein [Coprobacter tertius]MCP9612751.1 TolC family protein [Coprobacter tertius]
MKKIKLLFLGTCCCIGLSAQQQGGWSLAKCIDYAIENNITVKQRGLDKESSSIQLNTLQMSRLPSVNGGVGQNVYFGRSPGRTGVYEDQSQASTSFTLSASAPVFTGFRLINQVKSAKLDLKSAVEDLNKAKEDVSLQVTSYFLQVLFNKELVRIAKEQVDLDKLQLEKTEALVNAGRSPESALYDSRSLLATDELNLTQAENNLSLSLVDLSQMLNLETADGFDIEVPDVEQITIDQTASLVTPRDAFQYSIENRPGIKSAKYQLESSRYGLKVAKSGYFPTIGVSGGYGNSFFKVLKGSRDSSPSFIRQMQNNGNESVSFSLSVPIFDALSTRNQVRQARVRIHMQQLALENVRLTLSKEIEQAYYSAIAAHKKYISSEKSVTAAQIAFEYGQKKYEAGKSTVFEYSDLKTRYEKSLSDQLQAKYEFLFRSKVLDFYNGKPLAF